MSKRKYDDDDDLQPPMKQRLGNDDNEARVISNTFDKTVGFWILHGSFHGKNGRESDEKTLNKLKERHARANSEYYAHLLRKRYWIGKTQSRARGLPPAIRLNFAKRFLSSWEAQEKKGLGLGPGQLPLIRLAERVVQDSNNFFTIKPPRVVDHGMRLAMQHMIISWSGLPAGLRDENNIINRAKAYRELFAPQRPLPVPPDEQDGGFVMGVPRRVVLDYWRKTVARSSPDELRDVLKMFYQQLVYLGQAAFTEFPVHFYAGGWRPTAPGRADALSPADIRTLLHIIAQEPWLSLEYVIKRFAEKRGVTIPGLDTAPDTKSRKNRVTLVPSDQTRVEEGIGKLINMLLIPRAVSDEADVPMQDGETTDMESCPWPAVCPPRTVAPDGPPPIDLLLRWLISGDMNAPGRSRSSLQKIMGQFQKFLNKAGFVKGLPHEIDIVRSTNARNIKDIRNFRRDYMDKTWFGFNESDEPGGETLSRDFVFMDETTVSLKQHFGKVWMSRQAPIVHGTKSMLRGLYNMFISVGVIRGEPFVHWIIYRPQRLDGVKLGDGVKRYIIDSAPSDLESFLTQGMNIYKFLDANVDKLKVGKREKKPDAKVVRSIKKSVKALSGGAINVQAGMTAVLKKFPERYLLLNDAIEDIMSDWQASTGAVYEDSREQSILDTLIEIIGAPPSDPKDDAITSEFRNVYNSFQKWYNTFNEEKNQHYEIYFTNIKIYNIEGLPLLFDGAEYEVSPAKKDKISALRMVRRVIIGHVGMKVVFKTRMAGIPSKIFGTIGTTLDYFFGTYHKNATRQASGTGSDFPAYSLFDEIGKIYDSTQNKKEANATKTRLDVLIDLASSHMAPNHHIKTVKRVPLFSIMKRYGGQIIRQASGTNVDVNLVYLPSYAPEFNPCERVNGLLKRHFQKTASKRFSEDFLRKSASEFFKRLVVDRPETLFNLVRGCGFKFAHDRVHLEALESNYTIKDDDEVTIAQTLQRMCNNPDASDLANMPLAVKYQRRRHVLCVDEKTGQLVKYFSPLSLNVNNMYKKRPMWIQVSKHESLFNVNLVPIHTSMGDSVALKNKLQDVESVQIRYAGYKVEGEAGVAKESRELCTKDPPNVFEDELMGIFWDAFVECCLKGMTIHVEEINQPSSPRLADVYFFIKPPDLDGSDIEYIFVFRLLAATSSGQSKSPYSFDALLLKHALIFRARDNSGSKKKRGQNTKDPKDLINDYIEPSDINSARVIKIKKRLEQPSIAKNKEGSVWRFRFEGKEETEPSNEEGVASCEVGDVEDDEGERNAEDKRDDAMSTREEEEEDESENVQERRGQDDKRKKTQTPAPKHKNKRKGAQNTKNASTSPDPSAINLGSAFNVLVPTINEMLFDNPGSASTNNQNNSNSQQQEQGLGNGDLGPNFFVDIVIPNEPQENLNVLPGQPEPPEKPNDPNPLKPLPENPALNLNPDDASKGLVKEVNGAFAEPQLALPDPKLRGNEKDPTGKKDLEAPQIMDVHPPPSTSPKPFPGENGIRQDSESLENVVQDTDSKVSNDGNSSSTNPLMPLPETDPTAELKILNPDDAPQKLVENATNALDEPQLPESESQGDDPNLFEPMDSDSLENRDVSTLPEPSSSEGGSGQDAKESNILSSDGTSEMLVENASNSFDEPQVLDRKIQNDNQDRIEQMDLEAPQIPDTESIENEVQNMDSEIDDDSNSTVDEETSNNESFLSRNKEPRGNKAFGTIGLQKYILKKAYMKDQNILQIVNNLLMQQRNEVLSKTINEREKLARLAAEEEERREREEWERVERERVEEEQRDEERLREEERKRLERLREEEQLREEERKRLERLKEEERLERERREEERLREEEQKRLEMERLAQERIEQERRVKEGDNISLQTSVQKMIGNIESILRSNNEVFKEQRSRSSLSSKQQASTSSSSSEHSGETPLIPLNQVNRTLLEVSSPSSNTRSDNQASSTSPSSSEPFSETSPIPLDQLNGALLEGTSPAGNTRSKAKKRAFEEFGQLELKRDGSKNKKYKNHIE